MKKILIGPLIVLMLMLFSCNNESESTNTSNSLANNSLDSKNIFDDDTILGVTTFDLNDLEAYSQVLFEEPQVNLTLVEDDSSINRVYYSPTRKNTIADELIDQAYEHERSYYKDDEVVWTYRIGYKKFPLENNFTTKPIWITDEEVLLSELDYDRERVDNLLVNLTSQQDRPRLSSLTNIRGFSRNQDKTKIIFNIDSADRDSDLSGVIEYDIQSDTITKLIDTTFNNRDRDFDAPDRIRADITNFEFIQNLRQNMVWARDNNIYYTDTILITDYQTRVERLNLESKEKEVLLKNAYILNESPDKRFIVVNDEEARKTLVWDFEKNKKIELDYSEEFQWHQNGLKAIFLPLDKPNQIHHLEISGDQIIIQVINIQEVFTDTSRVVNLAFDEQDFIHFDVCLYKLSKKEAIEYFNQVLTYKVEFK